MTYVTTDKRVAQNSNPPVPVEPSAKDFPPKEFTYTLIAVNTVYLPAFADVQFY